MIKNRFENVDEARRVFATIMQGQNKKCSFDHDLAIKNLEQAGAIRKSPLTEAREKTDEIIDQFADDLKAYDFDQIRTKIQSERQIVDAMIKEKE